MSPLPSGKDPGDTGADAPARFVPLPDEEKRVRFSMFAQKRQALLAETVRSSKGRFTPQPRKAR